MATAAMPMVARLCVGSGSRHQGGEGPRLGAPDRTGHALRDQRDAHRHHEGREELPLPERSDRHLADDQPAHHHRDDRDGDADDHADAGVVQRHRQVEAQCGQAGDGEVHHVRRPVDDHEAESDQAVHGTAGDPVHQHEQELIHGDHLRLTLAARLSVTRHVVQIELSSAEL